MSHHSVQPIQRPLEGTIRPPGSKSLTNRALVVAALADGPSRLTGVLVSKDTEVMIESLRRLGIAIDESDEGRALEVHGCGGRLPAERADLWLENSGTSIRFLTALCALGHGAYRLDGNPRMRQRPIVDLVEALRPLGAEVHCETDSGCPPLIVKGAGLRGGCTRIKGNVSSQYLSALLMAAPCAASPVEIEIEGDLVSQPYVDMTLGVMARFAVTAECTAENTFHVEPQAYRACEYEIEPDASAASYFFAAAAVTGGTVTVEGISYNALQGDIGFVDVLEKMGCRVDRQSNSVTVHGGELQGVDVDMRAISDTAQTLAAIAPFASGPTTIRNIAHARHKETDRIAAVANELRRLGQHVEEHEDGLTITPAPVQPACIQTYDDHRMAMSFALVGLRTPGIQIADPECTAKTYPKFFEDLERLCESAR